MSNPVRIQPDLQFVKDLQQVGGDTLKRCYQCATCSVACPISPAENPYPRKEMIWAQWGLKDKLVNDIDIWLCHNCGNCSDLCPRGAKPGDLLAALRNMAYRKVAEPAIVGEWMSSSKYLPILIAIPAILWLVIWTLRAGVLGTFFPTFVANGHEWEVVKEGGKVVFGGLFPGDFTIDPIFVLTFFFMVWTFYKGVKRLIASFDVPTTFAIAGKPNPSMWEAFKTTVGCEIATHSKWKKCGEDTEADQQKFKGHLTLFYAFLALLVVTGSIATGHWGGNVLRFLTGSSLGILDFFGHTPLPFYNPIKLLAIVGACLFVYGLAKLTTRRMNQNTKKHGSSWYDWYLLGLIWTVGLTGIFSLLLRLANVPGLAYPMYYVHLVAVWMLIAYLPWSKLGHLVYRTAALTYARHIGRIPMETKEEKTFVL
ncbi:4Fe-4S ferredoxin, iron-sulpur binding domain-containing protein [Desulfovibrio sp. X2]|uniref:quinone-interacting membrane-bound oxidoreductase complex subunit QmoC n=1 Tax=Desulfovibrio sp. X2 TaxID=941449 RepID=UPI0003589DF0|nr:quinone-interacting membrane-bound oxidoreductase complex subunit QmoC [Desulfovibrio sp. X2]EPR44424.1 4Fe-4S ferredoxin, iron-sulpur binding domain-containing protein [Desulfovibrio sp. X2]